MSQAEEQPLTHLVQSTKHAAVQRDPSSMPFYPDRPFNRFHHHNLSDSTNASNDSSPTTTISTVDDSSATEPSPGSSPESPPPTSFATSMLRPRTSHDSAPQFFELQKQPPPRKGRNLKNLAVNTSRNTGRAASTTSLPLNDANSTVPSITSPAFVKPPSPPRRKPSNLGLTLLTPGTTKAPPQEVRLAIPPTPAFGRPGTLRHFQSSPSLPLFSGLGSSGSAVRAAAIQTSLDTILSPVISPGSVQTKTVDKVGTAEEEQNFDVPLSREEKPEAYPDGPICIYDPYVDLYLEPTAEQCRQYDVVMNVASEVRNPLIESSDETPDEPEIRIDGGGGIQYAPKRPLMDVGLGTNGDGSPTTPKATPLLGEFSQLPVTRSEKSKGPEYIHIPWEHNTDIVPDLLRLVKLIEERVKQKKRILIHCQCGVSRSASLVVAFGLYMDPTQSVQEAYDAVKSRSKWIGPNMNLIMQLQEFRTSLTRGGVLPGTRGLTPITPSSALSEWQGPFNGNSQSTNHNGPLSAGVGPATGNGRDSTIMSPGPSSAPSGVPWPIDRRPVPVQTARARAVSAVKSTTVKPTTTAFVDPSGHIVPVLQVEPDSGFDFGFGSPSNDNAKDDAQTPTEPLASPRATEFAMVPLQPPHEVDAADSFGIMSPTSTGFGDAPFERSSLLASLGMGLVHEDETPRRSLSIRSRVQQQGPIPTAASNPASRLRGKISSPNLKEQQELQSLQAKIEATLPNRKAAVSATSLNDIDEALMSPRATEFTKNPFALLPSAAATGAVQGLDAASVRDAVADPRSPAQTGVSPITRNIMDVL